MAQTLYYSLLYVLPICLAPFTISGILFGLFFQLINFTFHCIKNFCKETKLA
jgi:hypothetical protein